MAETIPGGAYQNPDGSWINAEGKPIAAPKGEVYIRPEEEAPLAAIIPGEEYGTPENMVSPEEAPKARRSSKKS